MEVCEDSEKPRRLAKIMEQIVDKEGSKMIIFCETKRNCEIRLKSKIIIFCETKRNCDVLTKSMRQDGWPALAIHGDKQQEWHYQKR
ncbi:hypothetical protein T484DRAFT_1851919 [Baffinella frigidus]|nr:hypothetical protein T484DRAFT_1851919 [Cryptophyta sp. CCMP2293]